MNLKKKEEFIEYLNLNYRTILSYGNKGLVPMGEFTVADIIVDEIPEEYSDMISEKSTASVVLKSLKDEAQEIVMPFNKFVSGCLKNATKNAEILSIATDTTIGYEDVLKSVELRLSIDEAATMGNELFKGIQLVDLEDSDVYLAGDDNGDNFSSLFICPVDLGKWREKIRERYIEDDEMTR